MTTLPKGYRKATINDADAMAGLVNIAGEGLPVYLWSKAQTEDTSAWDIGRERAKRDSGAFSYTNAIVREMGGEVISCLVSYPIEANNEPVDYDALPPMFLPLQKLEDMVIDTWYVNVLATYSGFRNRGSGSELLQIAEKMAFDANRRGLSIIVADSNVQAKRLYLRHGYKDKAQLPMIKEQWQHPGQNWELMIKEFE